MAQRYAYPLTVRDKLHFRLVLWWVKLTLWNASAALFNYRHCDQEIILLCVRWYLT
jgi:hypothetical protein